MGVLFLASSFSLLEQSVFQVMEMLRTGRQQPDQPDYGEPPYGLGVNEPCFDNPYEFLDDPSLEPSFPKQRGLSASATTIRLRG